MASYVTIEGVYSSKIDGQPDISVSGSHTCSCMNGKKDVVLHTVTHFLLHTSPLLIYCIVAVVLMLESSAIPITNNTLLLLTGAFASSGHLNFGFLLFAAILGSCAGACLAYAIGARGGRNILLKLAKFFRISEQKVQMAERWYNNAGAWMVFVSRMTPYIRPFACFPAGIARMPFGRFFIAASTGSLIWCSALLSIGLLLGKRWGEALRFIQAYTLPALAVLLVLLLVYIFGGRALKRRLQARYENSPGEAEEASEVEVRKLLHV